MRLINSLRTPRIAPKRHTPRGFTLVELMVALAAMALLALVSWRGLEGMTRSQSAHQARDDAVLVLQTALAQWRTDLDTSTSPDGVAPAMAWDGQTFRLTRRIQLNDGPALQVVAWSLRPGPNAQWWRWQSPPLSSIDTWQQAWTVAGAGTADSSTATPLLTPLLPLAEWQIQTYNSNTPNGWSNTPLTLDTQGVRLVLVLPPGSGLSGTLTQDWLRPTHSMARGG